MGFQDLTEVLNPYLDLPIGGKSYRIHAVNAATGLRMQATVELAAKVRTNEDVTAEDVAALQLDDDQERDFNRSLLGDAYDEMIADGVKWIYITRAARTAFMWTVQDANEALKVWSATDRPEARRPEPQDRKAPAKKKTSKTAASRSSSRPLKTTASPGAASSSTGG